MNIKSKVVAVALVSLAVLSAGISTSCKQKAEEKDKIVRIEKSAFNFTLTTDPLEVKDGKQFTVRLKVSDQAGKSVADAKLHGSLTMKTMDMGKNEFDYTAKGDGTYEATATADMAGPWEIKVSAKRGAEVGEKTFELVVKE